MIPDIRPNPQPDRGDEKSREIKERILNAAEELFMRYGFKSITMDEIARHLGVSKKTLYQHFEDKDAIVLQVISLHLSDEKCEMEELIKKANNPVEEFLIEMRNLRLTLNTVHPAALFELRKYHPKAWQVIQDYKQQVMIQFVTDNLCRGIQLGYYRDDIVPQVLARLRVEEVTLGFDGQVFPNPPFELRVVQMQLIEHFLHGILTDKGREVLNKQPKQTD